jgi:hypothetical protein
MILTQKRKIINTWNIYGFIMHPSKEPNKKAMALTCYLDESGTGTIGVRLIFPRKNGHLG